jgi:hypothetical protein
MYKDVDIIMDIKVRRYGMVGGNVNKMDKSNY